MVANKTGPNLLVVAVYVLQVDWIKRIEMNHKKYQNKLTWQVHTSFPKAFTLSYFYHEILRNMAN